VRGATAIEPQSAQPFQIKLPSTVYIAFERGPVRQRVADAPASRDGLDLKSHGEFTSLRADLKYIPPRAHLLSRLTFSHFSRMHPGVGCGTSLTIASTIPSPSSR
jgi:hypothetical protein